MPRTNPQAREVYRHFKGNCYTVIRVASDFPNALRDGQFCEYYSSEGSIPFKAASPIKRGDTVIFYTDYENGVWARSLDNFVEVLGDSKEGTQYYRFQLIGRLDDEEEV